MRIHLLFFAAILALQPLACEGYGVSKDTPVVTVNGPIPIQKLYDDTFSQSLGVLSYDLERNVAQYEEFTAIARGTSDVHVRLKFTNGRSISCAPEQAFLVWGRGCWVRAGHLCAGDQLLRADNSALSVVDVEVLDESLDVYSLMVEHTHLYCVGGYPGLLTHNMSIPLTVLGGAVGLVSHYIWGNKCAESYVHHSLIADWRGHREQMRADFGPFFDFLEGQASPDISKSGDHHDDQNMYCVCGHVCSPQADCRCGCVCGCGSQIDFLTNNSQHIFRNKEGHLSDTPENRLSLSDLVKDPMNYLGTDGHGNQWFAKLLTTGQQLWASIYRNTIRNAGLNNTPHTFDPISGLSRPFRPGK